MTKSNSPSLMFLNKLNSKSNALCYILALSAAVLLLANAATEQGAPLAQSMPYLKDAFKNDFGIGTALNTA